MQIRLKFGVFRLYKFSLVGGGGDTTSVHFIVSERGDVRRRQDETRRRQQRSERTSQSRTRHGQPAKPTNQNYKNLSVKSAAKQRPNRARNQLLTADNATLINIFLLLCRAQLHTFKIEIVSLFLSTIINIL